VSVFDPPQNDGLDRRLLRARIFECKGDSWGTEIDITLERIERQQRARYDLWCSEDA
jgi:hypothetical protein